MKAIKIGKALANYSPKFATTERSRLGFHKKDWDNKRKYIPLKTNRDTTFPNILGMMRRGPTQNKKF